MAAILLLSEMHSTLSKAMTKTKANALSKKKGRTRLRRLEADVCRTCSARTYDEDNILGLLERFIDERVWDKAAK